MGLAFAGDRTCNGMDDEQMVQQLKAASPCSDLPPLALAEVVHLIDEEFQVRRLHLIIVDMWRQKWLKVVHGHTDVLYSIRVRFGGVPQDWQKVPPLGREFSQETSKSVLSI